MMKSVCGVSEMYFLGMAVSALPLPSHVVAFQEFYQPSIAKELQAFLGKAWSTSIDNSFSASYLPVATHGIAAQRQGGVGAVGVVNSDGQGLCSSQASTDVHPTVGAALSLVVDTLATHVGACQ
jgi:hypothetical protein